MKIAIQGIEGCYHEIAARKFFSGKNLLPSHQDLSLDCCLSFENLFESMRFDPSTIGIVAIENTIAGSLLHNYQLLRDSGTRIMGEQKLRISHSCVCLPEDDWDTLTEINSHPVALAQCRDFLNAHPSMKVVESDDTAAAAKRISSGSLRGHAAICSRYAAELYGMKILEEGIETNKHNFTRFLIVANPGVTHLRPHNPDKASIVFSLPHEQGSLSAVLSILSFYHVNLTKIQSLPIIGSEWQYLFYIDVIFSDYDRYRQAIDALAPLTQELKILGEYEECKQAV